MNFIELRNYAFTLQIPAFKKIKHYDNYKMFKDYSNLEQESILYEFVRIGAQSIRDWKNSNENVSFDIKFEKHQDGRSHAHGVFYQICDAELQDIKKSIASLIGIKSEKQINDCCFCIPIFLSHGWNTYINKYQCNVSEPEEDTRDYSIYQFGKKK